MDQLIFGLVIAGVIMVLAEILIPGGVVGALGVVLLGAGIVLGFSQELVLGFALLIGSVVFGIVVFWLWVKYFPTSPIGKKVFLGQNAQTWHSYDDGNSDLVGAVGVSHTPLRPSGTALVDGRRLDVVTRGELIAKQTPVKVVAVHGNRIIVEAVEESEVEAAKGENENAKNE